MLYCHAWVFARLLQGYDFSLSPQSGYLMFCDDSAEQKWKAMWWLWDPGAWGIPGGHCLILEQWM